MEAFFIDIGSDSIPNNTWTELPSQSVFSR